MVSHLKIKIDINYKDQYDTSKIQITPAHQTKHQESPPYAGFVVFGPQHSNSPFPRPLPAIADQSQSEHFAPLDSVKSLSIVRTFLETPSRLRLGYPLASLALSLHIQ